MSTPQTTLDTIEQPIRGCSLSSDSGAIATASVSNIDADIDELSSVDEDDISSLSEFTIITDPSAPATTATPSPVVGTTTGPAAIVSLPAGPAAIVVGTGTNPVGGTPTILHGVPYYQVPATDMIYVAAAEQPREWYVVTRGVFVGVFKYSFQVDQATRKVSSAHGKKEDSLLDAVDHFNAARNSGWMRICGRPDL